LKINLGKIVDTYVYPQAQQVLNIDKTEFAKSGNYVRYSLMPLLQIHLHSNKVAELGANSKRPIHLYLFCDCYFHFADRLCEFHEPSLRPVHRIVQRKWGVAQSDRARYERI
jgi:hypothetical protein